MEGNRKVQLWLTFLLIAAVLAFGFNGIKPYLFSVQPSSAAGDKPVANLPPIATNEKTEPANNKPSPAEKEIVVHVTGAVDKPGLYRLPQGSRVGEAVQQAAPRPDAELHALNLAAPLIDGQKVQVPAQGEQPQVALQPPQGTVKGSPAASVQSASVPGLQSPSTGTVANGSSSGKININNASAKELETLPGIGPALAGRIIQHRESKGPFQTVEELTQVSGIGEKRFADLKDKVSVID